MKVAATPPPQIPTPSDMVAACRTRAPWDMGCRCDRCYLGKIHREAGTWHPVMPELNPGASAVALAEAPGTTEVLGGAPLIGKSGKIIESAGLLAGIHRGDLTWDNGALCQFPGNDAQVTLAHMQRENKALVAAGKTPWMSPFEACRPHVTGHLLAIPQVLALGKHAYSTITGQSKRIRAIRGAFIDLHIGKEPGTGQKYAGDPPATTPPRPWIRSDGSLTLLRTEDRDGNPVKIYPEAPGDPILAYGRLQVTPTLHPAFVLRYPAWRPVFDHDVDRFWSWVHGRLRWEPPKFQFRPSYDELRRFLSSNTAFAVDSETDGKNSLTCNLRQIAFARPEGGMVVPFLSPRTVDNRKVSGTLSRCTVFCDGWAIQRGCRDYANTYYSDEEALAIFHLIREFLGNRRIWKILHNCYFDYEVFWRELALTEEPGPTYDTILAFRAAHSELTRDLYTLGTLYTHVPDWKAAAGDRKIAVDPRTDLELAKYANTDTTVDIRCATILDAKVTERKQTHIVDLDLRVQRVYREAKHLGMRIDEPARAKLEAEHTLKRDTILARIRDQVGDSKYNPASTAQVGKFLFKDQKLPVLFKTVTGADATDDDTFRALIRSGKLSDKLKAVIEDHRALRKVEKELGTYILPWRRATDIRYVDEIEEESPIIIPGKKKRRREDPKERRQVKKGGMVGPDGRLHPDYNVATPRTGRASSSNPNLQNVPSWLRYLFIPEDDHVFIDADYDQIELRLIALIAGLDGYKRTIWDNGDPHAITATLLYGQEFIDAMIASFAPEELEAYRRTGVPPKASHPTKRYKALRVLAKSFIYAVMYGGTAKTVFEIVSSAEDEKTGKLLFPETTYSDIKTIYDRFMAGLPALPIWWDKVWTFAKIHKYIDDPIGGRRRDFPAFERNEIPNHPIQGGAAFIMSSGLVRVRERFPPNFDARTGVVNQCHDAIIVEAHRRDAHWVRELVEESLYQKYGDMEFTAKGEIVGDWGHQRQAA